MYLQNLKNTPSKFKNVPSNEKMYPRLFFQSLFCERYIVNGAFSNVFHVLSQNFSSTYVPPLYTLLIVPPYFSLLLYCYYFVINIMINMYLLYPLQNTQSSFYIPHTPQNTLIIIIIKYTFIYFPIGFQSQGGYNR